MQWIKVVHLLGIVFWMGSFLILTQIFRRHVEEEAKVQERLTLLEERLFRSAAHPGAALVLASGILLFLMDPTSYLRAGWFHAKLLLILVLFALHIYLFRLMHQLHQKPQDLKPMPFALLHGIGALVLTLVFVLVLVQPF